MTIFAILFQGSAPHTTYESYSETTTIIDLHGMVTVTKVVQINESSTVGHSTVSQRTELNFFNLTLDVSHWQNLTKSNINDTIFNFLLATSWSQMLCKKIEHPEFMNLSIDYLNQAIDTLNNTIEFNEYEFFNKFRNMRVIEDLYGTLDESPPPNNDTDVYAKFHLFIQQCVDFISNSTNDDGTKCLLVKSFNEMRNLIFSLNDEQQTVLMSEISSNVFSFASYAHLNVYVSATTRAAIMNSLCAFERDYNSNVELTSNSTYTIHVCRHDELCLCT